MSKVTVYIRNSGTRKYTKANPKNFIGLKCKPLGESSFALRYTDANGKRQYDTLACQTWSEAQELAFYKQIELGKIKRGDLPAPAPKPPQWLAQLRETTYSLRRVCHKNQTHVFYEVKCGTAGIGSGMVIDRDVWDRLQIGDYFIEVRSEAGTRLIEVAPKIWEAVKTNRPVTELARELHITPGEVMAVVADLYPEASERALRDAIIPKGRAS
jgi:hypothetical protein